MEVLDLPAATRSSALVNLSPLALENNVQLVVSATNVPQIVIAILSKQNVTPITKSARSQMVRHVSNTMNAWGIVVLRRSALAAR
jgi:hypothetical protein